MALFILSIASVSANNVSDSSDNQDSNILNSYDSLSSVSTYDDGENSDDSISSASSISSTGSASSASSISSTGSTGSDSYISSTNSDVSNGDESSINSISPNNSDSNSYDISSIGVNNSSTEVLSSSVSGGNSSADVLSSSVVNNSLNDVGNSTRRNTKNTTVIEASSTSVLRGGYYYVTLKDTNSKKLLSGKSITFTFNGSKYTKTTNSNGVAGLLLNASPGNYLIYYSYAGDSNYENYSNSANIKILKTPTTLVNSGSSIVNGKAYYLTLKDSSGNVLSGKTLSLTFNGKKYKKTTNSKGLVSLAIRATVAKTYKLTYSFAGDKNYSSSAGSASIKIKRATAVSGSGSTITKGNKYKVTLKNSKGKVLSRKTIVFTINGKNYTKTTNSKGVASLKISLTPNKKYKLTYKYAGSSYYGKSSKTVSLFVKTPTKFVNSGSSIAKGKTYYISLKDSDGKALAGKTVKLSYRGKTYKKTTNSKGTVGLKISSTIGYAYKFSYKYAGGSKYGSSSGFVKLKVKKGTSLTGPSSTTIIKGNKFTVKLKDSSAKALSGKTVTFNFNGKKYTKKTNSKGKASLTINAAAGKTYSFSYKYSGSSYYASSSSGTIKLSVKLKTNIANSGSSIMNGSNYKVTLKDSSGNPLANKKLSLSFNGKNYSQTTDSKGAASLNIDVSTPKKYILTYKFGGDNVYASSSGSVNLNVKSKTVFTVPQIVSASSTLKSYVEKNAKVSSTVSVNGISLDFASFTYLMSQALVNINSGKSSANIVLKDISSSYSNSGSSSINGNLTKAKYITLSNNLISYVNANSRLPNYINTSLGSVSPNLYSFGISKVLVFYSSNKRLANSLSLDASDVNGVGSSSSGYPSVNKKGNTSQYKAGLNEIANLTASQLKAYLTSSGNDALNSAIKNLANKLVSGKTTTWAKAEAIYNYVRDYISYSYYSNSKKGASGTLTSKSANCCDQANLVVALCRAANIPARFSHGKGCTFSSGLVTGHVWAQIYVDGVWYSADATSSRNSLGNIKNWNVKSFSNLNRYAHLPF
ncbi:transglutaminase domain-containing protein [Methanobrevibacter olleyae]|uniref:Adhesin-like protein with transglutaminase domain protein n=1 Tax=Methanobrevibacter olleyae TaxID=294671 RepID=A0A126QYH9_METOL|nr:Ig-like domain repeat protein [Methanobrevibacter olleyae]AMK14864.1 adhesin-like protein with transglutaminase domain protein [Methanobrevibacter olleyae]